jgi:asparagine N-glycosylation enzyme membrane subunit Stt3
MFLNSSTFDVPVLAQWSGRRHDMLYTLAVILLIAWLLGVVGIYTIGAFVHLLLVVALVLFLVQLLGGRRTIA